MTKNMLDRFDAEIIRSHLTNTVAEMVGTTARTAFSTCFSFGEDFTCGLFLADGTMVCQAKGVPVHAGGLGNAVRYVVEQCGPFEPGDVAVHNDPYHFGTHQADVLVCRPMYNEGVLVGLAANRGHWTDLGGMTPGGWAGSATDVHQEGLIIPAIKLFRRGKPQADMVKLLLGNLRMRDEVWGDLQAQIASTVVAERRVNHLIQRFGVDGYLEGCRRACEYSRGRFTTALSALDGRNAAAEDIIEDDGRGNGPFTIRVRLSTRSGRLKADFTGTDGQAAAPVNCTFGCTIAGVVGAVLAVLDPEIPLNQGVLDAVEVVAPAATLVNPVYPAPTFTATADPVARVSEVTLLALGQLLPAQVRAASYSTGNNAIGSGWCDGERFIWYSFLGGGCGAWRGADGNSAEWHLMGNAKAESMEVWESTYPVRFVSYRLIEDSGGTGEWRGGLGTERRMIVTTPTTMSGFSDHHGVGASGLNGGGPGLPNGFAQVEQGGKAHVLRSKFADVPLAAGDSFVSIQGGGGGYGSPADRDADRVSTDLEDGYITVEHARTHYAEQVACPSPSFDRDPRVDPGLDPRQGAPSIVSNRGGKR